MGQQISRSAHAGPGDSGSSQNAGADTYQRLRRLRNKIEAVKQQRDNALVDELRAELERLKQEEPEAYHRLLRELQ